MNVHKSQLRRKSSNDQQTYRPKTFCSTPTGSEHSAAAGFAAQTRRPTSVACQGNAR